MDELVELYDGVAFRVSFTKDAHAVFQKADAKERARCQKWMKLYGDEGHVLLDKTKLRNEGKFHTGGKAGVEIVVWAFKAWQVRAYGCVVDANHFIVTEVDTSKKQDAADQAMLKRAAEKIAPHLKPTKKK